MNNITVCDNFKPTILEGQLCYALDITNIEEYPTRSGKSNGLFFLVDPIPYKQNRMDGKTQHSKMDDQNFKITIHTLARYTTFGHGSYAMSTLKRMTGTKSFKQLPDYQKKCLVHNRDDCQTQKYLEQLQKKCKCIPWALKTDQVKITFPNTSSSLQYNALNRIPSPVA